MFSYSVRLPLDRGNVPIFPWVLWTLWTNRKKLMFEDKEFTVEESILKVLQDARAWKGANAILPLASVFQVNKLGLLRLMLHGTQPTDAVAWVSTFMTLLWRWQATSLQNAVIYPLPL
ncbi:hypothetical protein Bca4012_019254 [Brassica carinata]